MLREKVVGPLQPLCLSVLQNDKKSQDELQESVRLINVGLSQDVGSLKREADIIKQRRTQVIRQLQEDRSRLLDAIQDETRAIVFGGKEVSPIEAAKRVKQGVGSSDWIPSPVQPGATVPLSPAEIVALYQTNARVTLDDERELNAFRPELTFLPTPKQFGELIKQIVHLRCQDFSFGVDLWAGAGDFQQTAQFDEMLRLAMKAIDFLRDRSAWELDAIQAGMDGDEARRIWESLIQRVDSTWQEVQEGHMQVMAYGPRLEDQRSPHELLPIVDEIIQHIETEGSFGLLTKVTKPRWQQLIAVAYVGNRKPALSESSHFRAIRALLRTQLIRQELLERWERLVTTQGGPNPAELGERPERTCRQFTSQIQACLEWHNSTWVDLEAQFHQLGFTWSAYLLQTPPRTGDNAELRRVRDAVLGDLERILKARAGQLLLQHLEGVLSEWCTLVPETAQSMAVATCRLRHAIHEVAPELYQESYDELVRLKNLEPELTLRQSLLGQLGRVHTI